MVADDSRRRSGRLVLSPPFDGECPSADPADRAMSWFEFSRKDLHHCITTLLTASEV